MIPGTIRILDRAVANRFLNSAAVSLNNASSANSVHLNHLELTDMQYGFASGDSLFHGISTGVISYNRTDHDSLLQAYVKEFPDTEVIVPITRPSIVTPRYYYNSTPEPEEPVTPYDPLKLERVT